MTEELLTRIRKGIIEYKQKHAIKNNDVFAEHFIRSIAFSPKNPGFKLKEITKWKVLVEGDLGDVEILEFDTKDEVPARFDEEYPNGATVEASRISNVSSASRFYANCRWSRKNPGRFAEV